ncbi:MAG: TonB-dependent receptor [Dysgonomonas sp.]
MKIYLMLLVLISTVSIYAQKNQTLITGTISDNESDVIEFASISIKNSKYGSNTNNKGVYTFAVPEGNHSIVISALGYQTIEKTISVENGVTNTFNFVMEPEDITLNEVLVTSKSTLQKINESAYNVSAIDAKLLHNTTLDLSHALDRISGVRVRESGGVGSSYNFSLNGFTGRQVKFFIDGVPMENFGSSFQINNIPINLAEHIEVYKGVVPISLGSDALGGAVNIVTSNRVGQYVDASYSYGSFNTHKSYINAGYTAKSGFTIQINAFQNYSDNNYKITTDIVDLTTGKKTENVKVKRFHDTYHNETVIANVGVVGKSFADKLLFGITLGQNRADIQTGARMKEFVFGDRFSRGSIVMPSFRYLKRGLFIKGLDVSLTGNFNFGYEQVVDTVARQYNWLGEYIEKPSPGSESGRTMYKYKNNAGIATGNINYELSKQHSFTINNVYNTFDRKGKDELYPDSENYSQPRKTTKNVIGLGYKFDYNEAWSTSLFIKQFHQKTSYFETQTGAGGWGTTDYIPVNKNHDALGYGFASALFISTQVQLKTSYEKSIRMPGNEELFGNEGENMEGNMKLRPETSHNFNLGASYNTTFNNTHGLILDGSFLFRNAKDFIRPQLVTNGTDIVMTNQDKVRNYGFNGEIRYSYKTRLTAGINMTYQNIRNNTKYVTYDDGSQKPSTTYKDRMPNLPYLFGNADCSIFFNNIWKKRSRLSIGYNILYVNKYYLRWPSEGISSSKNNIPTQISQDINATYTLNNGMYNIALECRNIFDDDIYDNFSLQKPGRNFSVKFRYFFKK